MIIYSIACQECEWATAVEGDRGGRIAMETSHRVETGHMKYTYCEQVGAEEGR